MCWICKVQGKQWALVGFCTNYIILKNCWNSQKNNFLLKEQVFFFPFNESELKNLLEYLRFLFFQMEYSKILNLFDIHLLKLPLFLCKTLNTFIKLCEVSKICLQRGVCHTLAFLPFALKSILRQKKELWKLKYFTIQKYNLQKIL